MRRILVTGASGYIGRDLIAALHQRGGAVRAAYRGTLEPPQGIEAVRVGDLGPSTDWTAALQDIDTVVHLAGAAHSRGQDVQRVIVDGTATLAQQAAQAGVSRFIYMSSVKATAALTGAQPLSEAMQPRPDDDYGRAKLAAEQAVSALPQIGPVILRPPLVHGPQARANFASLLRLADTPLPLPLAGFSNRRSIIALTSLIDAVWSVLARPDAPAGVYHLADRPALSVRDIVAALRRGMGRKTDLFAAPGIGIVAPRALRESLEVDDTAFRDTYGYGASQDVDASEALERTAAAWKAQR